MGQLTDVFCELELDLSPTLQLPYCMEYCVIIDSTVLTPDCIFQQDTTAISGIIFCMCLADERRPYRVTPSLIGWAHSKNNPRICYKS